MASKESRSRIREINTRTLEKGRFTEKRIYTVYRMLTLYILNISHDVSKMIKKIIITAYINYVKASFPERLLVNHPESELGISDFSLLLLVFIYVVE